MKTISRYIMTLALLITAATGAWAEDTYTITFAANGNTKTVENVTLPVTYQCSYNSANRELDLILKELYGWTGGSDRTFCYNWNTPSSSDANKVVAGKNGDDHYITIDNVFEGTVTITGVYKVWGNETTYTLEITCPDPNAVEVTTNAASEGATFTEASFAMPAFDATAEYELVRDMAQQMTTKVGDAADGADYRIRLRKDGTAWELADMTVLQLMALISVHDAIEDKDLTYYSETGPVDCTLQIFAIDDNDQPTGDAISFANLEPGRYKAKAVAKADGYYIGETALSNVIVLFQGYPVEVAAKEYITYYKEENLTLDTEETDAKIYTITDVNGAEATATQLAIAPMNVPILVYNSSDVTKTVLLIPTDDQADDVTAYLGFVGTLEATTIAASTNSQNNYAMNGKEFIWVRTAIPVAANKAWLEVPVSSGNNANIRIVFDNDETTEIEGVDSEQLAVDSDDSWYDLQGRKLDGQPTTKGVYIWKGKKVAIK